MLKPKICHPERNEVESRDLRTVDTCQLKSVRRSFDSLRSLRMTNFKILAFLENTQSRYVSAVW